jgi:hypothetical protein
MPNPTAFAQDEKGGAHHRGKGPLDLIRSVPGPRRIRAMLATSCRQTGVRVTEGSPLTNTSKAVSNGQRDMGSGRVHDGAAQGKVPFQGIGRWKATRALP